MCIITIRTPVRKELFASFVLVQCLASADGLLMAEKRSAHARDKGGTPTRDATLRARADADPDSTATDREVEGTAAMDAEENAEPRNVSEENDENEEDGEEEDDDDDDDETEDDDTPQVGSKKDREMHLTKPFACVPIGATFELEGTSFKRLGYKRAECTRCNHIFPPKGYGRQMVKHGLACRRKAEQKEAREKAQSDATSAQATAQRERTPQERWPSWEGEMVTVTHTVDGVDVTVKFENVFIGACTRTLSACSTVSSTVTPLCLLCA